MKTSKLAQVRNTGFVAHIDAGKTTVTERVLFYAGKIHRMGEVHDGQATMDWMPQEQQRGITITSAVTTCYWDNHEIHIIDTPGHVDFTIEVERSLKVLDGAVMILCGVGGVEAQTETVWHQACKYKVPTIAFVNKLDRVGADYTMVLKQMRDRLEMKVLPLQLPYYEGDNFCGVIDLIEFQTIVWHEDDQGSTYDLHSVGADMMDKASQARDQILETLSDFDDEIMEDYLAGKEIDTGRIKRSIRMATIGNLVVPVLCGSALKNKGIQPLLQSVIDYLPSPQEVTSLIAHDKLSGDEIRVEVDPNGPLIAYVFKVYMDEGRRLVYLRIYSGTLLVGGEVYNVTRDNKEKIARLFSMHAHHKQRIEKASAGDIVAVVGLKDAVTGDTLSKFGAPYILEPIDVSKPVISVAIETRSGNAADRMVSATKKIMDEDPTIKIHEDPDTGQIILAGMGELHLEISIERLKSAFGMEINVGKPQVLYCTTIQQSSQAEMEFDKMLGEVQHQGHVHITATPLKRGQGNRYTVHADVNNDIKMHIIAGLEEACLADPVFGYEVVDIGIDVDKVLIEDKSTGQGMKIASQMAVQELIKKAQPVLMEPIMEMDVMVPEEYVGDVVGDLSSRKASIEGVLTESRLHVVKAYVPLSKTFGYSTQLRSLTRGRGSFNMKFYGFDKA